MGVHDQALLAAEHLEHELGDGGIGDVGEGGADAAFDGVDLADQIYADLTMQITDDVGQLSLETT